MRQRSLVVEHSAPVLELYRVRRNARCVSLVKALLQGPYVDHLLHDGDRGGRPHVERERAVAGHDEYLHLLPSAGHFCAAEHPKLSIDTGLGPQFRSSGRESAVHSNR